MDGARIVGLVVLAALTASCGASSAKGSAGSVATTTTAAALRVGESARNPIVETVISYADNVLGTSAAELPSNRAIAEIRVCVTPTLTGGVLVQASDFETTLTNGDVLTGAPDATITNPLRRATLTGSECSTGNVSWHLPDNEHARTITDYRRHTTWTVSCPSTPGSCVQPAPQGIPSPPVTMPTAP